MKTVGILTYHSSDNFGSVLQAYATCRMLRDSGFDGRIVDLRKPEVKKLYRILRFSTNPSVMMATAYNALHYGALRCRKSRYERFRREQMVLSRHRYSSGAELSGEDPGYDAYVVGSDQVWNRRIVDHDPAYFLAFAGEARRIAWAASCGPVCENEGLPADMKRELERFQLITLRENAGARYLAQEGVENTKVVPDPVFFLNRDQWCAAASGKKRKKKYMLCYFPGVVTPEFDAYTKSLARERGLQRVLLMPHWRNLMRRDPKNYSAGPAEFLALLRDADMVCTNSFHAAAFSVIFGKDFIVGTHSYGSDERINTLLERTGLRECEFSGSGYTYAQPDVSAAAGRLRQSIEESRALLLNALK